MTRVVCLSIAAAKSGSCEFAVHSNVQANVRMRGKE